MTAAAFEFGFGMAFLFAAMSVGGSLRRIAEQIEAQSRHYGIARKDEAGSTRTEERS